MADQNMEQMLPHLYVYFVKNSLKCEKKVNVISKVPGKRCAWFQQIDRFDLVLVVPVFNWQ